MSCQIHAFMGARNCTGRGAVQIGMTSGGVWRTTSVEWRATALEGRAPAIRYCPGMGRHSMISTESPGKMVKCGCLSNRRAAAS
jgi:hypothetical protein